jgi:altronate dehydratase large subunit
MSTIAADLSGTAITGYRRADGRLGLRNHLVVLSTLALTNRIAQLVAQTLPGAQLLAGDLQRGLRGSDARRQENLVRAVLEHPNTGGALVFVHDTPARVRLESWALTLGKPVRVLAFMEGRGVAATVQQGVTALGEVHAGMADARREPGHLGELLVALECGGSDPTSAVCANPTMGGFVDRLIAAGGSAIVSETAEFIGAEPVVSARARSPEVAQAVLEAIERRERMMLEDGENYRGVNPTEENMSGGLTTLVEKSMGAVAKCGSTPLIGALDFGERPQTPGLWFMDTPFFSPVSLTGMVAAGAQIILFGIGVFNPSANPLAPTVKVCGNPSTVREWFDAVDMDVSGIVDGRQTLIEAVDALHACVLRVCAGSLTWSERWAEGQMIVPRENASI